ncbi:MAG: efflux RND transporter permease subunit [Gammaproteobacteria bacterium]|nr:efflux RND transporter permease subunit [Gammaproteobacteria bacterium]
MNDNRGPIAWMAANPVAANLLMALFVVGGLLFAGTVKQEVFPEVELDVVTVTIAYPGASPGEVEDGIVLAVEEAIRSVDGIKKVSSTAGEGIGTVTAELLLSTDPDRALADVKNAVDRIRSFPADAEEPVVALATTRNQVLNLIVHGDLSRHELRDLTEQFRTSLLDDPRITLAEVAGLPPPEISIEISQSDLRRYGLTLDGVARAVAAASIDLPGGAVRTDGGQILVRTTEQRDVGSQYADITLISDASGTEVKLGDVADVVDGFRETDTAAFFDGQPAARIRIFRTSEQSPLEVAEAAHGFIEQQRASLPPNVGLTITDDQAAIFGDRIDLLLRNGQLGVLLVLLVLGVFLAPKLAFWVTLGMPISFLGVFLFMPALGVSINMISLFAFILTLGIVVDDAVVVGEAAFTHRAMGKKPLQAAIDGAREVRLPVTFAVLTTIIAFAPLLFVPGVMGKFFSNIPLIVIPVLAISLIESLFVLPAHVAHIKLHKETEHWGWTRWVFSTQKKFSGWMERVIEERYVPLVTRVVEARYLTIAIAAALLIVSIGVVAGGRLTVQFFPSVEADQVDATIQLPFGAPVEETQAIMERLVATAKELGAEVEQQNGQQLITGIYSAVGSTRAADVPIASGDAASGGHLAQVTVYMRPAGERAISAEEFARRWRNVNSGLPGVDRLLFQFNTGGPQTGAAVAVQLSHQDPDVLENAATQLAASMGEYAGVIDIDDGFQPGKTQLDLELTDLGRSLGLSERDLATQVRSAFYGAEAKRQQRGRDELRVFVRLPQAQRSSLYYLDNLILRTPTGGEIPLRQAATIREGSSFTSIERVDGRRIVEVTSGVDSTVTTGGQITASLERDVIPGLLARTPGLTYQLSGEQEAQAESLSALGRGMLFALIAMYAIMAVAFRSYVQPLLVLMAIPFGLIGAVFGHLVMGYSMSLISVLGLVALSGVVINDLLVLIYAIDARLEEGASVKDAIVSGAARRVRPIVLTSLTTFFGLSPMIFETSLQARFLIPMALSLGFGVLFVTAIALLLMPAAYMALEDIRSLFGMHTAGSNGSQRRTARA